MKKRKVVYLGIVLLVLVVYASVVFAFPDPLPVGVLVSPPQENITVVSGTPTVNEFAPVVLKQQSVEAGQLVYPPQLLSVSVGSSSLTANEALLVMRGGRHYSFEYKMWGWRYPMRGIRRENFLLSIGKNRINGLWPGLSYSK